jgi:hypothetical protein
MKNTEFNEIAARVSAVAGRGVCTGNDAQDHVLQFDAILLTTEVACLNAVYQTAHRMLDQAKIENPSDNLAIHARQVVEALWTALGKAAQLEQRLAEAHQRANVLEREGERLRKELLAAEGREKALELKRVAKPKQRGAV